MQTVRNTLPRRFGAPGLPELNASQVWLGHLTLVEECFWFYIQTIQNISNHDILDSISTMRCNEILVFVLSLDISYIIWIII